MPEPNPEYERRIEEDAILMGIEIPDLDELLDSFLVEMKDDTKHRNPAPLDGDLFIYYPRTYEILLRLASGEFDDLLGKPAPEE